MLTSLFKGFVAKAAILLGLTVAASTAYADLLEDIIERGEVRIGVSSFEPWTMKTKKGELAGFEIEVGNQLAKDMGVKATFVEYEWDHLIPAIEAGDIDVIAAGMAITPHRALRVNFSAPYMTYGVTIATNTKATRKIKGMSQLNRDTVTMVVVADTIGAEVAENVFPEAKKIVVKTSDEAEKTVVAGDAHAMISSVPVARFASLRHPDEIDLPLGKPLIATKAAFGIAKGEEDWARFLDAWVIARDADGWLARAEKYWFESLAWQAEQK